MKMQDFATSFEWTDAVMIIGTIVFVIIVAWFVNKNNGK